MTLLFPLFLIPAFLCLGLFVWLRNAGAEDDWGRVIGRAVLAYLRPARLATHRNFVLLALAIVLAALASPSRRAENADAYALDEGVLVVADVSKSMSLDDIRPSRLAAARAAILQLSEEAGARPMALIAFSGDAFLLQPFAADRVQFNAFAAALDIGLVPQEGSNLERALALATSVIEESRAGRVRVVLVGDGGGFSESIPVIATRLSSRGHRVDVLTVADPTTTNPVSIDLKPVQETVNSGKGALVFVGADGLIDLSPLRLGAGLLQQSEVAVLALRSTDWRNLSHYLLLLALPVLLLAFRQVRP